MPNLKSLGWMLWVYFKRHKQTYWWTKIKGKAFAVIEKPVYNKFLYHLIRNVLFVPGIFCHNHQKQRSYDWTDEIIRQNSGGWNQWSILWRSGCRKIRHASSRNHWQFFLWKWNLWIYMSCADLLPTLFWSSYMWYWYFHNVFLSSFLIWFLHNVLPL